MKTIALATMLAFTGCAADAPADPNVYDVVWSDGHSDSPGVTGSVACTDVVAHPCALRLYATELRVDPTVDGQVESTWIEWGGFEAGSDANGKPTAELTPPEDVDAVRPQGYLSISHGGDESGLRYDALLAARDGGGWEGDVTWALFTVAGKTTFHVTITPR